MFIDLNVAFEPTTFGAQQVPAKGKQKQNEKNHVPTTPTTPALSATDMQTVETKLDTLVYLGYSVISLNQTILSKFDPATHRNHLLGIKDRDGVVLLRRLTIILDEGSEKGIGLTNNNIAALSGYDIIALLPTTTGSFSQACLSHSVPSSLTAHIITLDLASQARLPFQLKLSLVKTAIKNGAVFEICYGPALSISADESKRRNWWANAREVARVTGGKGLILSSGGVGPEMRGPKDVINLATLLGIDQDKAKNAITQTPKSVIIRAQTRKTYRAVLSEPTLVFPDQKGVAGATTSGEGRPDVEIAAAAEALDSMESVPPTSPRGGSPEARNAEASASRQALQSDAVDKARKRNHDTDGEHSTNKKKKKKHRQ